MKAERLLRTPEEKQKFGDIIVAPDEKQKKLDDLITKFYQDNQSKKSRKR